MRTKKLYVMGLDKESHIFGREDSVGWVPNMMPMTIIQARGRLSKSIKLKIYKLVPVKGV